MTYKQIQFIEDSIKKSKLRFNSYIIANKNREESIEILENSTNKINLNLVLFHIETNNIGKEYENLIIFPLTTQFQINSIEYQNHIYIIKISILSNLFSYSKKNPFDLVNQLCYLNQYDQAEIILSRLLIQYPYKASKIYNKLAQINQNKGLYELSLQLYEKSLNKISFKYRPFCLNNMGSLYDDLNQYDLALEFYSSTFNLLKNDFHRAICMNNIGITLAKQEKYQHALDLFQQSLEVFKDKHLNRGMSYVNIAGVYSSIHQFDLALKFYENAAKIFPKNSSYRAIIHQNIGEIFYLKNQFKEALHNYQKALNIFQNTRPSNHPTIIYTQQIINQLTQII